MREDGIAVSCSELIKPRANPFEEFVYGVSPTAVVHIRCEGRRRRGVACASLRAVGGCRLATMGGCQPSKLNVAGSSPVARFAFRRSGTSTLSASSRT